MQPFRIDRYRDHDASFVIDSWLRGYRTSPSASKLADDEYEALQRPTIDRLLSRSTVLVARPLDWPEGIMGYLVAEQTPSAFVVHWSHVKPAFRSLDIRGALIDAMEPRGRREFTHFRPPFTDQWIERGYRHAPTRAL